MEERWVGVVNQSRGGQPIIHARWCESRLCRMRGLTFRRKLPADQGLLLVGRSDDRAEAAIHMVGVFFSIGVVWIDSRQTVVDCTIARPLGFYFPRQGAKYILEGPLRLLETFSRGERVEFVDAG